MNIDIIVFRLLKLIDKLNIKTLTLLEQNTFTEKTAPCAPLITTLTLNIIYVYFIAFIIMYSTLYVFI